MHIDGLAGITGDKQIPLRIEELAPEEFEQRLTALEKGGDGIVYLEATLDDFERLRQALCAVRASNLSPILLLGKGNALPSVPELEAVAAFLRDWDQLFLFNLISLFEGWIPEKFIKDLTLEAKIELKWFREWLVANQDSRLSRYPGLPWRSYIRKVIGENFQLAEGLLRLGSSPERDAAAMDRLLLEHLRSRKKAIAFFPKKWSKLQ